MRTSPPEVALFEPEAEADPHGYFAALRERHWYAVSPLGPMVLGYRAVHDLVRDPRLLSYGTVFIEIQGVTEGPLHEWWRRAPLHIDGDDHARIRRLVSRVFTPRAVEALRPFTRKVARELADHIDGAMTGGGREVEFMAAFADQLPVRVMCRLLGVPDGDVGRFGAWARSLGIAFGMHVAEHRAEIEAAVVALYDYVDGLIAERRGRPGDDLLSGLVQIQERGERLSPEELQALVVALLFAGHDTTRNQLGCAALVFAEHQDQWARLADDPSLVPSAVEEVLRFEPATGGTARIAAEAFDFEDLHIEGGALVSFSSLAANRDPEVFPDPHGFDVARRGEPPVTFGGGVHYCLGAALARLELQEALAELSGRWRAFEVTGPTPWRPSGGIRGPDVIPLRAQVGSR